MIPLNALFLDASIYANTLELHSVMLTLVTLNTNSKVALARVQTGNSHDC